ncbi:MAG: lipid A biosynthesis acyltransferase [Chromatiaceae bacterium]|nr:lipid A biosynthesis acyltransferase [Gammaproteobacteria bacterium]MCP5426857.1 lipid A biosynthesis acyltransferase [Chromatiaceae bacterium]MCB1861047.1 lipid A biosynthesis acyltransferase [Gammaproteobacteria bacterium]MCB1873188.1 lipid A biosynthesis acyltransferase [Gammaproteobacteria bacterium]MCB1903439.1 lipid A biosynthesis acyltransferase [Gammaproteobacteria bacterium]
MAEKSRTALYSPLYWPTWIALALLWIIAKLAPYSMVLALGRMIGRGTYLLAGRRRHIAKVNIAICFPELTQAQQQRLVQENFEAAGISLLMLGFSWWASDKKLQPLMHYEGVENLEKALTAGYGVILVGAHFVDLDFPGRLLGQHYPFAVTYRQHENPVIEWAFQRNREKRFSQAIPRGDFRAVLRTLKKNGIVWLATDQAKKGKHTTMAPFFGVPASTSTVISRVAAISGAPVMLAYGYRLSGKTGYILKIAAPIDAFPGTSVESDTARINLAVEQVVREAPAQYLWMHRRFKKRAGLPDPYNTIEAD